jgi:hypothetical protein
MVTSVSRPITADTLATNTLPLPLLVFIPAKTLPMHPAVPLFGSEQKPATQVAPELLPRIDVQSALVAHANVLAPPDTEQLDTPPVITPFESRTHAVFPVALVP